MEGSSQQRVQEVPAFGSHFAREHRRVSASIDSLGGFIEEVSEAVGQTWACLVSWAAINCWNRVSGEQGDSFEDVKKLIAA